MKYFVWWKLCKLGVQQKQISLWLKKREKTVKWARDFPIFWANLGNGVSNQNMYSFLWQLANGRPSKNEPYCGWKMSNGSRVSIWDFMILCNSGYWVFKSNTFPMNSRLGVPANESHCGWKIELGKNLSMCTGFLLRFSNMSKF